MVTAADGRVRERNGTEENGAGLSAESAGRTQAAAHTAQVDRAARKELEAPGRLHDALSLAAGIAKRQARG